MTRAMWNTRSGRTIQDGGTLVEVSTSSVELGDRAVRVHEEEGRGSDRGIDYESGEVSRETGLVYVMGVSSDEIVVRCMWNSGGSQFLLEGWEYGTEAIMDAVVYHADFSTISDRFTL
ncbi:hypothetical protein Tco_0878870 [Tanacetum coccineum]|uniref:Uncharacterized protein n=1 Tax=Tanacetum coccineum TaxID=301880 RepID=A0ABQ5C0X1_9ASTR